MTDNHIRPAKRNAIAGHCRTGRVRYVINLGLHSHEKALPDEAVTVDALGNLRAYPSRFQEPDRAALCTALKEASDGRVHVHCIANYRVSAFFYRYRRTVLGMDAARARA